MTHTFNATILREYDIRGIVGKTLHEDDAYALGRTYAAIAREEGAKRIAVGRDGRTHSGQLEAALVRGLTEGGIDAVLIGRGPSPMLYFATYYLDVDGGIQVTGSHNPADYNGFKMLLKGGSVFGEAIQHIGRRASDGHWSNGEGTVEEVDISQAYVDRLVEDFQGGDFRIGWDAGNGAAGPILDRLVDRLPGQHFTIFTEIDGTFPNHHPDPTVEANLEDLKRLVADKQLDFGIAFDGDGDRIGAVDGKGRVIWGDQLMLILAEPVLEELPGATIIADVKASQVLFDGIAALGGKPLMWNTGHSLIKSKMKETGAPLAGEMSGHIFFKHRWYGFDDALYAAVRLIEAVSRSGKSLTELMDAMPSTTSTPELRFPVDESRKFAVIDEVRQRLAGTGAKVDSTDGVRVNTGDGWWLLRASNTQDVLVARAESSDESGLARLMAQIDEQLGQSGIERTEGAH
ncbi:phosphomannomutase/phosphoglucomutase [Sphingomonas sinipercae]|uniref:Phosphomannomutase/phosphoglucomutase n=1 Tax=Sphingomonas sinipercae TaxID=2714944 RepID=A0A6G7ZLN7_9SPHN|nr:phosphomannomutase/phosphoglucomutase [Sphingomonas sinipercae]QIL01891.1 phosphomannomutase/phosphoglucomutase [Sphingomonas sinipercae]